MSLASLTALLGGKSLVAATTSALVIGGTAVAIPTLASEHAGSERSEDARSQAEIAEDGTGSEDAKGPDDEADDTAHRVWGVKSGWGDAPRGCAFGQSVAAAARGEEAPTEFPCDRAAEHRAAAKEHRAAAKDRRAAAKERAAAGRANAEDDPSAEAADEGLGTAQEPAGDG